MYTTQSTTTWQPRRTRSAAAASLRTTGTATMHRHAAHRTRHTTRNQSVEAWARRAAGANGFGDV